ncbi:hypothetical protein V2S66_17855 [Streptomyces sp. V4-01]|uniref:Toxin-antitoxin system HicB family antitoxin n=1 Tax=Actinacidiphila polyblastidii TaxID=3110430 RepID=A0ABU7PDD6_9ACTN|nr:hypothetical protein [Streptomyces sp. V4-01]
MAKTQLNVRVDEATAETARERASQRGISVNRYIEELVKRDEGENGRAFVQAAADFMERYEAVFAEEFDGRDSRDTADPESAHRLLGSPQIHDVPAEGPAR